MQSTGSPLFCEGRESLFQGKATLFQGAIVPLYRGTGAPSQIESTGGPPYSDAGSPLSLGRTCRFPEGRVPLFPRDANPFSEGRGCTLSQERVPLPEDGDPSCEGGISLFRGTADPSPKDV